MMQMISLLMDVVDDYHLNYLILELIELNLLQDPIVYNSNLKIFII
jgi:hypothetical protein